MLKSGTCCGGFEEHRQPARSCWSLPAGARIAQVARFTGPELTRQADEHVLHVVMVVQAFEEGFDFRHLLVGQAADRVLRLVAQLGREHGEALLGQGFLHRVEVRRLGQEQGRALFARLEILGPGFDGRQFRIGVRAVRRGFDHADMVEVPGHRTRSAQLALAESHADFRDGTVDVVSHALDDQRHLVRRETFVGHAVVLHGLAELARTFLDRTLQGLAGHRGLFRLLHHQTQVCVGGDVSAVAGSNGDLFDQLAEDLALGVGCCFFVFNLPLCAHYSLSLICGVELDLADAMGKFIRPEGTNRPKSQIRDHLSRPSALVGLARHGGEPGQAHVASIAHRSRVGTR
ncbi:transposase [Pseudomonas chlororaphis]